MRKFIICGGNCNENPCCQSTPFIEHPSTVCVSGGNCYGHPCCHRTPFIKHPSTVCFTCVCCHLLVLQLCPGRTDVSPVYVAIYLCYSCVPAAQMFHLCMLPSTCVTVVSRPHRCFTCVCCHLLALQLCPGRTDVSPVYVAIYLCYSCAPAAQMFHLCMLPSTCITVVSRPHMFHLCMLPSTCVTVVSRPHRCFTCVCCHLLVLQLCPGRTDASNQC